MNKCCSIIATCIPLTHLYEDPSSEFRIYDDDEKLKSIKIDRNLDAHKHIWRQFVHLVGYRNAMTGPAALYVSGDNYLSADGILGSLKFTRGFRQTAESGSRFDCFPSANRIRDPCPSIGVEKNHLPPVRHSIKIISICL